MEPAVPFPSRLQMLIRGFTGRCAVCGKNRMSLKWLSLSPRCERCNFAIERKEGHFVGAVGMNTIFTFGALLIFMVVSVALTWPDIPAGRLSLIAVVFGLALCVGFFPISKTLWSAVDLMMVELEPGEVDPRFDPNSF